MSLTRKYRPSSLQNYLGQETREILKKRFKLGKPLPNVILLTGGAGTGKTTAARILSTEYQCLDRTETGYACGKCVMCEELKETLVHSTVGDVTAGVLEVDVASDSGKNDIQAKLEEVLLEPIPPIKYHILILDEFHMATRQTQNMLLKVLEEPPKHLVFMLCTTNPEKIIDTILSRVQFRLSVKKASIEEMTNRLEYICKSEGYDYTTESLTAIANLTNRVPREALNLLENIFNTYGQVTLDTVGEATNSLGNEIAITYFKYLKKGISGILEFISILQKEDIDLNVFYNTLCKVCLDATRIRFGIGLENYTAKYTKALQPILKGVSKAELSRILFTLGEYSKIQINDLSLIQLSLIIGGHIEYEIKDNASAENKQGFSQYVATLKQENTIDKIERQAVTGETVHTVFEGAKQVTGGIDLPNLSEQSTNSVLSLNSLFSD